MNLIVKSSVEALVDAHYSRDRPSMHALLTHLASLRFIELGCKPDIS